MALFQSGPRLWRSVKGDAGPNLVLPIYAMFFAMQCARSMYIVVVSWFALHITGEVSAVGKVLVCWQLLGFAAGPFVGTLVDRFKRRSVFIVGECIHGGGIGLLAVYALIWSPDQTSMPVLYVTACIVSVGSLLSFPAIQALVQLVGGKVLMRTISVGMFSGQIGNIAGAVIGGLCLAVFGIAWGLIACASFSIIAAVFAFLLRVDEGDRGREMPRAKFSGLVEGMAEIIGRPPVLLAGFAILLAYSSAHAANAFLAGFTRYDLNLSANEYGWIAAMYSGGGLFGSIALAYFSNAMRERYLLRYGAFLLAASAVGFSTAGSMGQAIFWHALAGLAFTALRVGSDVTILKMVPNDMIGRVRSNIQAGVGMLAITIYFIPSLFPDLAIRQIYLVFGCVVFVAALGIIWMQSQSEAVNKVPAE